MCVNSLYNKLGEEQKKKNYFEIERYAREESIYLHFRLSNNIRVVAHREYNYNVILVSRISEQKKKRRTCL